MEINLKGIISFLMLTFGLSSCSTLKTSKAIFVSRDMERSIKFNSNVFEYLHMEEEALEKEIQRQCISGSFSVEVEKMFNMLKEKKSPLILIEVGVCYQLAGEFSKALYYYDQGLSLLKKNQARLKSTVFNNLGIMFAKRDQLDKAYRYLEKSLLERPNNFISTYNMALILTSIGRYDESISLISKFRGKGFQEKQLRNILGIDFLSVNDLASLESKVINRLDDNLSEKTFLQAMVKYIRSGDSKVVYEMVEDLEDLNPIYQQLYNELIRILKQKIREDESRKAQINIPKWRGQQVS